MMQLSPDYKRALKWALALHVAILVMILVKIDFPWQKSKPSISYAMPNMEVVQAHVVSQEVLDQQQKREEQKKQAVEDEKKRQQELVKQQQIKREKEAAAKKIAEQKKAEALKLAEQKKQQEAEAARVAELEKQKQVELAKQQAEQQAAKEAADLEAAKQQQLLAEQQAISAQQQANLQQAILTEVERYRLMVQQKIQQNWMVQRGYEGLSTQLEVRVAPSGTVLDVQIISKSGNEALDRSAISAVHRASPLPVPTDPAVFESFRQIRLTLRPEDVLGG